MLRAIGALKSRLNWYNIKHVGVSRFYWFETPSFLDTNYHFTIATEWKSRYMRNFHVLSMEKNIHIINFITLKCYLCHLKFIVDDIHLINYSKIFIKIESGQRVSHAFGKWQLNKQFCIVIEQLFFLYILFKFADLYKLYGSPFCRNSLPLMQLR